MMPYQPAEISGINPGISLKSEQLKGMGITIFYSTAKVTIYGTEVGQNGTVNFGPTGQTDLSGPPLGVVPNILV